MNGLALYAGYAGLDIGLGLAEPGYRTVCYVEREAGAAANLVARMAAKELCEAPIWDDSGTFNGYPWRGTVDIITAGFPCPEVSVAGKRKGIHGERWLWGDVARIIREVRPRHVFLENVRGLLSANDGSALSQVLGDLASMGFDAWWGCVSATSVGANHKRERIKIVANANGRGRWAQGDDEISPENAGDSGGGMGNSASINDQIRWEGAASRKIPFRGSDSLVGYANGEGRKRRDGEQSQPGPHNLLERPITWMGNTQRCGFSGNDWWKSGALIANGQFPMVDTDHQRCREARERQPGGAEWADWYGGGLQTAPPRPDDDQAWIEIIERAEAATLPAICRVANGSSKRVDRLRMGGNGVYPLAAAYAWRVGQAVLAAATDEGVSP